MKELRAARPGTEAQTLTLIADRIKRAGAHVIDSGNLSKARIHWQDVVHDNDFPTGTRMMPMFVIQCLALVRPDSRRGADSALRRPRLARMVNPF